MQKDQLLKLRENIVAATQEIALNGDASPEERLQILMNTVRDGRADVNVLTKVFELVSDLDGDDQKLPMMLDLLYEVDNLLAADDDSDAQPNRQPAADAESTNQNAAQNTAKPAAPTIEDAVAGEFANDNPPKPITVVSDEG